MGGESTSRRGFVLLKGDKYVQLFKKFKEMGVSRMTITEGEMSISVEFQDERPVANSGPDIDTVLERHAEKERIGSDGIRPSDRELFYRSSGG